MKQGDAGQFNTLLDHGSGLSAAAIEGVATGCIAADAVVFFVFFYAIRKNLKRLKGTSVNEVERKCLEAIPTTHCGRIYRGRMQFYYLSYIQAQYMINALSHSLEMRITRLAHGIF
ncbi:hypothetical protein BC830DRAFT_1172289 [Chytriomyces sp. MP71]|nr:hypothetical protein BC830DRAFT_1172289 [Chytriomyces sp. MP71]